MPLTERNEMVETFAARGPDQALAARVGVSRQLHRRRAVHLTRFGLRIPSIRCEAASSN
jgi:hypothetical protein